MTSPCAHVLVWQALALTEQKSLAPAAQPASLKLQLLPFQCEGVAWMCHQVRTGCEGLAYISLP
jgi:hypothetical protein